MVTLHFFFKFFWADIDVVNLDVKILAGTEGVVLVLNLLIADLDREVFYNFFVNKSLNDLYFFFWTEDGLLVLAFLDLGAKIRSVNQDHMVLIFLINKENGHVGSCCRKDIGRHGHNTCQHLLIDQVLTDFLVNT